MKSSKPFATTPKFGVSASTTTQPCKNGFLASAALHQEGIASSTHNSTTEEEQNVSREEWETMVFAEKSKDHVFQCILSIVETPSLLARAQRLLLRSSMLYFKTNTDPLDREGLEEDEAIFGFLMDAISVPLYQ